MQVCYLRISTTFTKRTLIVLLHHHQLLLFQNVLTRHTRFWRQWLTLIPTPDGEILQQLTAERLLTRFLTAQPLLWHNSITFVICLCKLVHHFSTFNVFGNQILVNIFTLLKCVCTSVFYARYAARVIIYICWDRSLVNVILITIS